jgi:hypothetical protein
MAYMLKRMGLEVGIGCVAVVVLVYALMYWQSPKRTLSAANNADLTGSVNSAAGRAAISTGYSPLKK